MYDKSLYEAIAARLDDLGFSRYKSGYLCGIRSLRKGDKVYGIRMMDFVAHPVTGDWPGGVAMGVINPGWLRSVEDLDKYLSNEENGKMVLSL